MTLNQEFEELLEMAADGDDEELFHIFLEHKQLHFLFATAQMVLSKYPEGIKNLHSAIRQLQSRNADNIIFELAAENFENGLFSPDPQG